MSPLILVVAGAAALYALTRGKDRTKRVGKSGTAWYVETIPGQDPGSVGVRVFASPSGDDQVLAYTQVNETGQRFVTFTAPSVLGITATADFI